MMKMDEAYKYAQEQSPIIRAEDCSLAIIKAFRSGEKSDKVMRIVKAANALLQYREGDEYLLWTALENSLAAFSASTEGK